MKIMLIRRTKNNKVWIKNHSFKTESVKLLIYFTYLMLLDVFKATVDGKREGTVSWGKDLVAFFEKFFLRELINFLDNCNR